MQTHKAVHMARRRIQDPERRLDGKTAVVVGSGRSGRAAARLLRALGAAVRVLERDADRVAPEFRALAREQGMDLVLGEHAPGHFADADMVVPSPGVPIASLQDFLPAQEPPEMLAELELAARYVTEPVVAVTGTNGKTTTVTLMDHLLRATGRKTFLGGNIGTPLSEYVLGEDKADVLVLEVSSFQLQGCRTFRPWVACLLNFSPNHLDYHKDMEEYLQAKLRLFANQQEEDLALFPEELRPLVEERAPTLARVVYFEPRRRFHVANLLGEHNRANVEAAYQAARYFGLTECEAQLSLNEFRPLPHRLEPVAELDGVLYVNDSKATTTEALRAALESFDRPVRLLAGGVWKGGDLEALLPLVRERVRSVGLFGMSREIFEGAWQGAVEMFWEPDLRTALARHRAAAEPGDVVLLSPATASFDQYSDYKARGDDFKAAVQEGGQGA